MAEAAVSIVVEMLGSLVIEKVAELKNVEEEVKQLKIELEAMQCFLRDAMEKQVTETGIQWWISAIREVAFDIEDAVDSFTLKVDDPRKRRGLLERSVCFPKHVYYLKEMQGEIQVIMKRLKEIGETRLRYGIQRLDQARRVTLNHIEQSRHVSYWCKDEDVVGLEGHVQTLLDKAILVQKEGLSIASITGMGGVGKSTLAKQVYNHERVVEQYKCRAWVSVSQDFNLKEVLKELLQQLKPQENGKKNRSEEDLKRTVYDHLLGRKYFLVLDDVWKEEHFKAIVSALPKRGRLLITSRSREIMNPSDGYVHDLKGLGNNDGRKLFLSAIKCSEESNCPDNLKKMGDTIVEKSDGLPLVITVMAGLLLKQGGKHVSAWEVMKSHLEEQQNSVSAILELSYWDLPPRLKSCFLFLSFFKEDARIDARTLIQLWIAEGIVLRGNEEETMEEIAKGYLDELINRNMVQPIKLTKDGRVKYCQIHDLLRDISLKKAKKEINFHILKDKKVSNHTLEKPRHLSSSISLKTPMPYLCSLFLRVSTDSNACNPLSFWESLGCRVKVLEIGGLGLTTVSKKIGTLVGLKYLGLCDNQIKKLPRSLGRLNHLQTLDISGNRNIAIPNVLWKLDSLRHLYMPQDINCKEPLKLGTLKNLQTLLYVSTKNIVVGDLENLVELRELRLEVTKDADKVLNLLPRLKNLVSLGLSWRRGYEMSLDMIDKLEQLTILHIFGKLTKLPNSFPQKLSCLKLSYTNLKEDPMRVLGEQPNLSCLKLFSDSYIGEKMVIVGKSFRMLEVLSLVYLPKLRQISIENKGPPKLKEVIISDCRDLEILPKEQEKRLKVLQTGKISGTKIFASKLRAMVETTLSAVDEKLGNLVINALSSQLQVGAQVTKLRDRLSGIQPFLKDAAERRAHDESVRGWMSDIRKVALDTADVIESLALKVDAPLLGRCALFPRHEIMRKFGQEFKSIQKRLEDIDERRRNYEIQSFDEPKVGKIDGHCQQRRQDRQVIGLEEHVESLLTSAIFNGREGFYTACIVGTGGIGKSTLAKEVYNHANVAQQFECRAWLDMSPYYNNLEELLRKLLLALKPGEQTITKNLPELEHKVHNLLRNTRYFIVLDDLWEPEVLKYMSRALPKRGIAGRLLITSRDSNILDKHNGYVHRLTVLNSNASWELFQKVALSENNNNDSTRRRELEVVGSENNDNDSTRRSDLEVIGKKIMNWCSGLPLAICVMGGMLFMQGESVSAWETVLEGMESHFEEYEESVYPILELCYQHLSPRLRNCFLHLCFKVKGAPISAQISIEHWIAEGIVPQGNDTQTMEEIGRSYLDELINRNMVEVVKVSKDGQVKIIRLHDLLQDLCVMKAKNEIYFHRLSQDWYVSGNVVDLGNIRHLVLFYDNAFMELMTRPIPHIRSLFIYVRNDEIPPSFWKNFGYGLRTLGLLGIGLTKGPEITSYLIGLKFLVLSNEHIQELPRSLGHLNSLQTLRISKHVNLDVPNVICKLESLRHLYMPSNIICKKRLKLDTLKNLQTLTIVSTKNIMVKHLDEVVSLRKLKLELTTDADVNELLATLAKLEHLNSMGLSWSMEHELSLDGIVNLQHLTLLHIFGKLAKLPDFPESLSYMKLRDTNLNEDPMPALGKLPDLLHLKLVGDSYVGENVKMHDGFPQLKILNLCGLNNIREIYIGNGGLPKLDQLNITTCNDLKILPEEQNEENDEYVQKLKMMATICVQSQSDSLNLEDMHSSRRISGSQESFRTWCGDRPILEDINCSRRSSGSQESFRTWCGDLPNLEDIHHSKRSSGSQEPLESSDRANLEDIHCSRRSCGSQEPLERWCSGDRPNLEDNIHSSRRNSGSPESLKSW